MKHKRIKYPKLLILLLVILLAIFFFYKGMTYSPLHNLLVSSSYAGTFISGLLYASGFTAPFATAVLLVLAQEQNIFLSVLIGGLGAVISDFLIFLFVRRSFKDEIEQLEKERIIKSINKEGKIIFGHYYKHIFPVFAGFLIASPLPTEIGVTMMAGIKRISLKKFIVIAFILHSLGILSILLIGNLI